MEHRCTLRKPCICDVIVDNPPAASTRTRSRNVGVGGIFVDTTGVPFPPNAAVAVSFSLRYGKRTEDFRLAAMVVRATAQGAALMYLDVDAETLLRLRGILRRMPTVAGEANLTADAGSRTNQRDGYIVSG